jgi:hypothetical protein
MIEVQKQRRSEQMRPIIEITGAPAERVYETLNELGDEKRYISLFVKDGRQLIQVIDANDKVHNFDLEGATIDIKHYHYHNFMFGEVLEENMDFNHWEYKNTDNQKVLTISNTNKFA